MPGTKGGLIFHFAWHALKMDAKSLPWALSTQRENAQGRELVSFFGDVSQSEILSEIQPPLGTRLIIGFNRMAGAESILDLLFYLMSSGCKLL